MTSPPLISYDEAVRRLYSLERWGIKLGLSNILALCKHLGDPHLSVPSIHIAGTNGKGSVASILEAIYLQSGYRVGLHTSPHLRDLRERIRLHGEPISRNHVRQFVSTYWRLIHRKRYSYFETLTALAFDTFVRSRCDLAVVEVGLGGRFDATNILAPVLSVITHIDFDHERTLGKTLSRIAFEKAGVIKAGTPVLIGPLPPEAARAIQRVADRKGAPVFTTDEILRAYGRHDGASVRSRRWQLPLMGAHQRQNCRVAVAAALIAQSAGIALPTAVMSAGVAKTHWPARFQIDPGSPDCVYDVAHNPSGMRQFVQTWKRLYGPRRAVLVFTARDDKRYREMWTDLAPIAEYWIGCPLPHSSGIDKETMQGLACRSNIDFEWAPKAQMALRRARQVAGPDGIVAIVGSHYLIGDIIPARLVSRSYRAPQVQELTWSEMIRSTSTPPAA